jgi:tryptophan-rich sensory protein
MAEDGVGRDGGAWPRWAAAGLIAGVLGVSAIIGRRNAPDPAHPGIRHWYRHLDKPDFTPPDRVFGAVWPVLETLAASAATDCCGDRPLRSATPRSRFGSPTVR